jgi:16S rRNA pseudouridine516 synthase
LERLDKVLANLGYGTRKEVKAVVKEGRVQVDGKAIFDSSMQIDPEITELTIDGEAVKYRKYIYIMLNKPEGVVSATFDNYDETVIDLLAPELQALNPFPVGRLDKDTVGLLLITNDGELNHRLISPKWHVDKVYFAQIDKPVSIGDVKAFEKGITLDDGYRCLPAKLEILSSTDDGSDVLVTIQEGKFHQVKRMFQSAQKNVVFLKRIKFGEIKLDEELNEGDYRELSKDEIKILKQV